VCSVKLAVEKNKSSAASSGTVKSPWLSERKWQLETESLPMTKLGSSLLSDTS
jgi:hypothetical protein